MIKKILFFVKEMFTVPHVNCARKLAALFGRAIMQYFVRVELISNKHYGQTLLNANITKCLPLFWTLCGLRSVCLFCIIYLPVSAKMNDLTHSSLSTTSDLTGIYFTHDILRILVVTAGEHKTRHLQAPPPVRD